MKGFIKPGEAKISSFLKRTVLIDAYHDGGVRHSRHVGTNDVHSFLGGYVTRWAPRRICLVINYLSLHTMLSQFAGHTYAAPHLPTQALFMTTNPYFAHQSEPFPSLMRTLE